MNELEKMKQKELEEAKQKYEECIDYAEKWLKIYKETKDENFKIGFELNMMQVSLYVGVYGFALNSRYIKMNEELQKLKQGAEI